MRQYVLEVLFRLSNPENMSKRKAVWSYKQLYMQDSLKKRYFK